MSCRVEKSKLSGKISCPSNKSYTHRAIMLASLANGKSTIENVLQSSDTEATIQACKNFGAILEQKDEKLIVIGLKEFKNNNITIDAQNSGTTIRIAAAMASLSAGTTVLSGDESLIKRPMQPLLDALENMGAKCSSREGKPPITVSGIVRGGEISIPGNISSQFITALMIIGPRTEKGITINIEGDLVSKPYIDATIQVLEKFQVQVEQQIPYKKFQINPKAYDPAIITIPPDYSSLALILSAAILVGKNLVIEINKGDLPQGDEKIIDFVKDLGVNVVTNDNKISVTTPARLTGGRFDLKNTPDLLPPLAILALKTEKPIELFNVKHARYKETDRIAILARELKKLGVRVKEKEDGLILESPEIAKGAELNSENDHRLFMAFCIAGMYVGDCKVSNPESIEVSYPNFITDMVSVGGKIKSNL